MKTIGLYSYGHNSESLEGAKDFQVISQALRTHYPQYNFIDIVNYDETVDCVMGLLAQPNSTTIACQNHPVEKYFKLPSVGWCTDINFRDLELETLPDLMSGNVHFNGVHYNGMQIYAALYSNHNPYLIKHHSEYQTAPKILLSERDDRFQWLKAYMLDAYDECEVYGSGYSNEQKSKYSQIKGSLSYRGVEDLYRSLRVMPVFGMRDTSIATTKYIECISNACIPICHTSYDSNRLTNLPDELFFQNPCEFDEKFWYYNVKSNYDKMMDQLFERFMTPDILSGKALADILMTEMRIIYEQNYKNRQLEFRKQQAFLRRL